MPISHLLLIALAGVTAGAMNALVGSGTLLTFPTLVALGYPAVTSTMSNAVGFGRRQAPLSSPSESIGPPRL
ncbi:integral membrane protein [Mycobacterium xenopi RIVM700367]|nr:integral membrane protein [Mycobacterium xenopi RIVM700367]